MVNLKGKKGKKRKFFQFIMTKTTLVNLTPTSQQAGYMQNNKDLGANTCTKDDETSGVTQEAQQQQKFDIHNNPAVTAAANVRR